jgi:thymidylate synthase (FAD)
MNLIKPSYQILTDIQPFQVLRNIEAAGRTCYKSEDKITNNSASNFVTKIIKSGHESVIEHESISVRFICDRGVSHELVRHRLCAFSQESTRYCDYGKKGVTFVIPPWVDIKPGQYTIDDVSPKFNNNDRLWFQQMNESAEVYCYLLANGWSPQQARSVLPNSLETEIVMTANLREWRHILKLRTAKAAHPQMREIMCPLLEELASLLPEVFDDIKCRYFTEYTMPDGKVVRS